MATLVFSRSTLQRKPTDVTFQGDDQESKRCADENVPKRNYADFTLRGGWGCSSKFSELVDKQATSLPSRKREVACWLACVPVQDGMANCAEADEIKFGKYSEAVGSDRHT